MRIHTTADGRRGISSIVAGVKERLLDYLGNHHVTVKGASSMRLARWFDVFSNLGDDGSSKGDVGDKVAIPKGVVWVRVDCQSGDWRGFEGMTNMMSTWSQSAPWSMVRTQSAPS